MSKNILLSVAIVSFIILSVGVFGAVADKTYIRLEHLDGYLEPADQFTGQMEEGSPSYTADSKFGSHALVFDSHADNAMWWYYGGYKNMPGDGKGDIEAWFYIEKNESGWIFSSMNGCWEPSVGLFYDSTTKRVVGKLYDKTQNWHALESPTTIELNTWHHGAVSWDEGSEGDFKLYIDDVEVASLGKPAGIDTTTCKYGFAGIIIGARWQETTARGTAEGSIIGRIDEFKFSADTPVYEKLEEETPKEMCEKQGKTITATEKCGNKIGYSLPGLSSPYCEAKDCCSWYQKSHIHDFQKVFSGADLIIEYVPGFSDGCTDTVTIEISQDNKIWKTVGSFSTTSVNTCPEKPSQCWKKYVKKIANPGIFRYVKITIPKCYNDYSAAYVCGGKKVEKCTDTDGGKDIYKKGVCKDSKDYVNGGLDSCQIKKQDIYEIVESCEGNECFVYDYFCSENKCEGTIIACPNSCKDGACIKEAPKNVTNCTDTDGGIDYYVKGTTKGAQTTGGRIEEITDFCDTELYDGNGLVESYCENDFFQILTYGCQYGCKDGACVKTRLEKCSSHDDCSVGYYCKFPPEGGEGINCEKVDGTKTCKDMWGNDCPFKSAKCDGRTVSALDTTKCCLGDCIAITCLTNDDCPKGAYCSFPLPGGERLCMDIEECTDSDGGDNIFMKGTCVDYVSSYEESCYTQDKVKEFLCSNSKCKSENKKCPSEYCFDGACLTEDQKCVETDSGEDYYNYGELAFAAPDGGWGYIRDTCNDDISVGEVYCRNDILEFKEYICPNGCKDGACVKGEAGEAETEAEGELLCMVDADCPSSDVCDPTTFTCTAADEGEAEAEAEGEEIEAPPEIEPPEEMVCTPNSRMCMEDALQVCEPFGNAWRAIQVCDYGCNPILKRCNPSTVPICTDSDGGGMPFTEGTTYGLNEQGNYITRYDECLDGGTLREYYCVGYTVFSKEISCEYGCRDNACVPPENILTRTVKQSIENVQNWLNWFYESNRQYLENAVSILRDLFGGAEEIMPY